MPTIITIGSASAKAFGWSGKTGPTCTPSQQAYTAVGTFSWVAPVGVTRVSVVAVGGAGLRGGGGLGYKNNYTVVPGNSYSVVVGAGLTAGGPGSGNNSTFVSACVLRGGAGGCQMGGTYTGDGGGNGGNTPGNSGDGGGGAGGYAGNGGRSGSICSSGSSGAGGGGGGGGAVMLCPGPYYIAGGGGGVGILGQGSSGAGGAGGVNTTAVGGSGGSGGSTGGNASGFGTAANGGNYGGAGSIQCSPGCVKDMGVGGKVQSASSGPVVLGLSQQQELETNNESLY